MEQKNRWYGKGIITAFKIVNKIEEETPEVRQKILILDIFGVKGIEYIKDMFGVGRSTIYLWKKKLKEEGIIGLRNKSRAPIHTRKSTVGEEIKEFVKKYSIKLPTIFININKQLSFLKYKYINSKQLYWF